MAGSLRFPRSARLLAKADFDAAFQGGTRLGGQFYRLHVVIVPGSVARLGCALAKRAVPHATDRNRLRRQVREAFRLRQGELGGRSIVVVARPEAAKAANPALRADLERLLARAAALPLERPAGTMSR